MFRRLCPDEDFLPRAPDPEDIVLEGEERGEGWGPEGGEGAQQQQAHQEAGRDARGPGEEVREGDNH